MAARCEPAGAVLVQVFRHGESLRYIAGDGRTIHLSDRDRWSSRRRAAGHREAWRDVGAELSPPRAHHASLRLLGLAVAAYRAGKTDTRDGVERRIGCGIGVRFGRKSVPDRIAAMLSEVVGLLAGRSGAVAGQDFDAMRPGGPTGLVPSARHIGASCWTIPDGPRAGPRRGHRGGHRKRALSARRWSP